MQASECALRRHNFVHGVWIKQARVEMERKRQGSLRGDVLFKQMDQTFDATDERECFYCRYDLHLSAVGCSCSPEKYACIEHALLLCTCVWGKKYVLCRVDLPSLDILLAAVEGKPNYVMAIIKWQKMQEESRSKPSLESQVSAVRHAEESAPPAPLLRSCNGPSFTEDCNEGSSNQRRQAHREQGAAGWGIAKNEVHSSLSVIGDCNHSSVQAVQVSTPGSQVLGARKATPLQECQSSFHSTPQLGSWMGKPIGPDMSVRLSKDQPPVYILPGTSGSDASVAQYAVKPVLKAEEWSQQHVQQDVETQKWNSKPDQFPGRPTVQQQILDGTRAERQGGPRVAKVVRTRKSLPDAELLHVGTLVLEPGYHDKNIILPAGTTGYLSSSWYEWFLVYLLYLTFLCSRFQEPETISQSSEPQ